MKNITKNKKITKITINGSLTDFFSVKLNKCIYYSSCIFLLISPENSLIDNYIADHSNWNASAEVFSSSFVVVKKIENIEWFVYYIDKYTSLSQQDFAVWAALAIGGYFLYSLNAFLCYLNSDTVAVFANNAEIAILASAVLDLNPNAVIVINNIPTETLLITFSLLALLGSGFSNLSSIHSFIINLMYFSSDKLIAIDTFFLNSTRIVTDIPALVQRNLQLKADVISVYGNHPKIFEDIEVMNNALHNMQNLIQSKILENRVLNKETIAEAYRSFQIYYQTEAEAYQRVINNLIDIQNLSDLYYRLGHTEISIFFDHLFSLF